MAVCGVATNMYTEVYEATNAVCCGGQNVRMCMHLCAQELKLGSVPVVSTPGDLLDLMGC